MIRVEHGDSREVLKTVADCSIDSVVTDPPYALVSIGKRFGADGAAPAKGGVYARASAGFMGKRWDTGETAFAVEFWAEVMRVLKPGGHVLAASGTRTYHRLACAVEDAGFEIRDMVSWMYGSGFPKSHDVSKGIDRAAGVEREVTGHTANARPNRVGKETKLSGAQTIGGEITSPATPEAAQWSGWGTALKPSCEPWVLARKPLEGTVAANVLAHGTGALNIDGCRVAAPGETISNHGESGGSVPSSFSLGARSAMQTDGQALGRWPANVIHDGSDEVVGAFPESISGKPRADRGTGGIWSEGDGVPCGPQYGDFGSAARFFYTAKATSDDRLGSKHPTVKPVDLMRYLARLVTPPGGTVLDPFAGTGSTGVACVREGFNAILIEREDEYVADIRTRIAHAQGSPDPAHTISLKARNRKPREPEPGSLW